MHLNGPTQTAAPLGQTGTGHHPGSCPVGACYCDLHRRLLAQANTRAAPWRPCRRAHQPGDNAAAEPDRAPVAVGAALAYRHVQPYSTAASDFNSNATTDHGEVSDGDAQPNRQRYERASDAARGLR